MNGSKSAAALDQAVGYAFARSALQAAVVAHDFYGHEGGSQGVSCTRTRTLE